MSSHIDPKILGKIKKCLALGQSDNPHEAATAIRQANALMQKHGVNTSHVARAQVGQASATSRTMARDKPAAWEANLAATVGRAFGCQLLIDRSRYKNVRNGYANKGEFIFIGQAAQAEIAAYTTEVLARKCRNSRKAWITQMFSDISTKDISRAERSRAGDMFATGWVQAIRKLVRDFANPPEIQQAIDQYANETTTGPDMAPARKPLGKSQSSELDAACIGEGMRAAAGESLYRPMDGRQEQGLLESTSAEGEHQG